MTSRWTLRAVGVLVVVLVIPTVLAYVLGLNAGEYNARSWLTKEHRGAVSVFMRAELGELGGWAHAAGSRRVVQRAAERRDRVELLRTLAEGGTAPLWWIVEDAGDGTSRRVVTGVDPACAEGVLAVMDDDGWDRETTAICPSGPVVLAGVRFAGMPTLHLVAGLRLDQPLVDRIAKLTGTELVLRVDGDAVAASFHDATGRTMVPQELVAGFPTTGNPFGEGVADLPDYAGFLDAYSGERLFVGSSRQAWYMAAAPLAGSSRVDAVLAIPRAILQIGPYYTLVIMSAGSVLVLVLVASMVRAMIRRYTVPLDALLRSAEQVAQGDLTGKVPIGVTPEMAGFCSTYNAMLVGLEERIRARSRISREAGMAELAVGMLHNVGNALNGVTSGAELADEGLDELPLRQLQQLARLLEQERDDLPSLFAAGGRGEYVPAFVAELTHRLEDAQNHVREELDRVRSAARHASAIVRSQERYAHRVDASENCGIVELVEEALRIACLPSEGIEVVRSFHDIYAVVDRDRLIEIVVNLLKNAADAIAGHTGAGQITMIVADAGDDFRVVVADDGPGISAERAEHVFQFGYSTKPEGHGFGLHASCNAAVEMGGALRLEPTPGYSTTFVVSLPRSRPALAA
jgi:signal transduction histidine kinase